METLFRPSPQPHHLCALSRSDSAAPSPALTSHLASGHLQPAGWAPRPGGTLWHRHLVPMSPGPGAISAGGPRSSPSSPAPSPLTRKPSDPSPVLQQSFHVPGILGHLGPSPTEKEQRPPLLRAWSWMPSVQPQPSIPSQLAHPSPPHVVQWTLSPSTIPPPMAPAPPPCTALPSPQPPRGAVADQGLPGHLGIPSSAC